jgi:hypothetical protein
VEAASVQRRGYTCYETNEGDIEVCMKQSNDDVWGEKGQRWSFYFKNVGKQTVSSLRFKYSGSLCYGGSCTSLIPGELSPEDESDTSSTVWRGRPSVHIYQIKRQ